MESRISASKVLAGEAARITAEREIGQIVLGLLNRLANVPFNVFMDSADVRNPGKGWGATSTALMQIGPHWRVTHTNGNWPEITYDLREPVLRAARDDNDPHLSFVLFTVPTRTATMLAIRAELDDLLTALYERLPQLREWLDDRSAAASAWPVTQGPRLAASL